MTEYRARLDAAVTFSNGGSLHVQDFLVDVPGPHTTHAEIEQLLVASLGLLLANQVSLHAVEVVEQAHKGTRGGPSDIGAPADGRSASNRRLVELNHVIAEGLVTYPGLPAPEIAPFLTRADSRGRYAEGTEFAMDIITMIGNTGTYLDSPYHRYDGGTDLAGLELDQLVDLDAVVVRITDSAERGITAATLAAIDAPARFGTPQYAEDAAFLSRDGAQLLVDRGVALVGIDSVNIDAAGDLTRPAHSLLLAAGIPIVEHLAGLEQVPPFGARFSAVPPRLTNFGTFPVRAFASVPVQ